MMSRSCSQGTEVTIVTGDVLKPYMVISVSAYGSTEGENKPYNILNIFHQ